MLAVSGTSIKGLCFVCTLLGGAATCSEGFVMCFLRVPLACLGSMAAAVQPNGLGNSQFTKPAEQVAAQPSTTHHSLRERLRD